MKTKLFLAILLFAGTAYAQHSVTVNWTASSDAGNNPTITYNVYRAQSACTGSPTFAKLGSVAAGVVTFSDTTVSVGQTYAYVVTSVLNGAESVNSNCAQAVILPEAPTSVVVVAK